MSTSARRDEVEGLLGQVFDRRYRLDAILGVGGMGAVFKARHTGLGQDVAVKVLRPSVSGGRTATARFEREAKSTSRLDHPNVVRVTDFGELDDGARYLVMELLDGRELKQMVGRPWAPVEAVDVALGMLEGLEHAHLRGIVHRDLKPENVFLVHGRQGSGQVKIVDFGIAKIVEGEGAEENLTRTGMVFGTPRYMSPEQASGEPIDARSDLYAVGLILYELLSGAPPFAARESGQLLRMHMLQRPPPLPEGVESSLTAFVARLLEKSPAARYPDATQALDALRAARSLVVARPDGGAVPVVAAQSRSASGMGGASTSVLDTADATRTRTLTSNQRPGTFDPDMATDPGMVPGAGNVATFGDGSPSRESTKPTGPNPPALPEELVLMTQQSIRAPVQRRRTLDFGTIPELLLPPQESSEQRGPRRGLVVALVVAIVVVLGAILAFEFLRF